MPHRSRRLAGAIALAVVCGLVGAGGAFARGDADVSFDGVYHHGKPKKVVDFNYYNVPITCQGTEVPVSSAQGMGPMRVKQRKFHGTFHEENGLVAKITGKYAKNLSKVTGTIRLTGNIAEGSLFKCDSGTLHWVTN